jgi:hypothetical protein
MARLNWPDDHPNSKLLMYVDSSRQVLARASRSADSELAAATLADIEALVDQMRPGKSGREIQELVNRVGALVNAVVPVMARVNAAVDVLPPEVRAANARGDKPDVR